MSFFEKLGKTLGDTAQAVGKKSSELMETTKLNMSINTEESNIQKVYTSIGQKVYEGYTSGMDVSADINAFCEQIKVHEATIAEIKLKVQQIKEASEAEAAAKEAAAKEAAAREAAAREAAASAAASQQYNQPYNTAAPEGNTAPVAPVTPPPYQSEPSAEFAQAPAPAAAGKVCGGCQSPIAEGIMFCPNCGFKVG